MKFSLRFQKDEGKGASDRTSWMERTGGSQCIFTPVCVLWMMSTLAVVCLRIALCFRELLVFNWRAFMFIRILLVVGQLRGYHWSTRSQSCQRLILPSSCLSVRPSAWNNSVPIGPIFYLIFEYLSKICWENSSMIKMWNEERVLHMNDCALFRPYLAHFLLENVMFHTKIVGKIRTHILCSIIFFWISCPFYRIFWNNQVQPDGPWITV